MKTKRILWITASVHLILALAIIGAAKASWIPVWATAAAGAVWVAGAVALVFSKHLCNVPFVAKGDWAIGIYTGTGPWEMTPLSIVAQPILRGEDVSDTRARFVADPFLARHGDRWHLFFEVWEKSPRRRGAIGLASSADARTWRYERIVLREAFHLSFPHVFESEGRWYLVPESFEAHAVLLYEAEDFPLRWKPATRILKGIWLDPVVYQWNDRWWMWVTSYIGHELHLYHASRLEGPWTPHPCNPVIRGDARLARGAGRIFRWQDRLFRPAQDDRAQYGQSVVIREIIELSEKSYAERDALDHPLLSPTGRGWNADGMHHADMHRLPDGSWIAAVDGFTDTIRFGRK